MPALTAKLRFLKMRMVGGKLPHNEPDHGHRRDAQKPAQPDGGKPVHFLPLVQTDLQCGQPDRHQGKTEAVNPFGSRGADVMRVTHQQGNQEHRQHAHR
jgi:hypothetical protein